jgi:hypothetical protein
MRGGGTPTQDNPTPNVQDIAQSPEAYAAFEAAHPGMIAAFAKTQPGLTTGWDSWKDFVYGSLMVLGAGVGAAYLTGALGAAEAATASSTVGAAAADGTLATAAASSPAITVGAGGLDAGLGGAGALGGGAGAGAATGAAALTGSGETASEVSGLTLGSGGSEAPIGGGIKTVASNWLTGGTGDLIKTGIGVGGQLLGASIQSGAITDAAKIQAQSTANALAFEKQRYGDLQARLAPYRTTGQNANDRINYILGGDPGMAPGPGGSFPTAASSPVTLPATTQIPAPGTAVPGPTPGPIAPPRTGTVTMRAPDGSTNSVALADVPHYQQKGATVVQGAS